MQFVFGDAPTAWFKERLPLLKDSEGHAIGVSDGQKIICSVFYHDCIRALDGSVWSLQMSIASDHPGWAKRGIIRALFHYPFQQLGCRRVTSIISKGNRRSRKLCEGMGFSLEGTHKHGMPGGETALTYGLLREDCKWLGI